MNEYLISGLSRILPEDRILKNEPMSRHTTFRVGGCAACLITPVSEEEVIRCIGYLRKADIPFFLMGNGSNLLVSDKGYDGVILQIGPKLEQIEVVGDRITVSAGTAMVKVSRVAAEHSLTGLEFAAGIPGAVGGGVVMNAGAYDGDMSMVVEQVRVLNEDGEILELNRDSMEFGYRKSAIMHRNFVVLSVTFKLETGDQEQILAKMKDFNERRRSKQPLEYPSAGSTFKRPEGYFAGKLIEDAGCKGYTVGGACVSEKHSGFVINKDEATAKDIMTVICDVQKQVERKFDVKLVPEVITLGDFS